MTGINIQIFEYTDICRLRAEQPTAIFAALSPGHAFNKWAAVRTACAIPHDRRTDFIIRDSMADDYRRLQCSAVSDSVATHGVR